jgi:hypothetical protein
MVTSFTVCIAKGMSSLCVHGQKRRIIVALHSPSLKGTLALRLRSFSSPLTYHPGALG